MNCNIPTLNIDITDSVGDSAGKHNYNALVLDTAICNLSSVFYNNNNSSLETIFNNLSSISNSYLNVSNFYTDRKLNEINQVLTTVNVLSSFWDVNEIFVQYPINSIRNLAFNSIVPSEVENFINTRLIYVGNAYINEQFPPFLNNYRNGNIINLVFFLYNISPINGVDSLIKTTKSPSQFTYLKRKMNVNISRDSVYILQGVIMRYAYNNGKWLFLNSIYNGASYADPISKNTIVTIDNVIASSNVVVSNENVDIRENHLSYFTKSGSFKIPSNISTDVGVSLVAVAGGGGGGSAEELGAGGAGGGGGSGGFSYTTITLKAGDVISYVVGTGGLGSQAYGRGSVASGAGGGTTIVYLNGSEILRAVGGGGGNGGGARGAGGAGGYGVKPTNGVNSGAGKGSGGAYGVQGTNDRSSCAGGVGGGGAWEGSYGAGGTGASSIDRANPLYWNGSPGFTGVVYIKYQTHTFSNTTLVQEN